MDSGQAIDSNTALFVQYLIVSKPCVYPIMHYHDLLQS